MQRTRMIQLSQTDRRMDADGLKIKKYIYIYIYKTERDRKHKATETKVSKTQFASPAKPLRAAQERQSAYPKFGAKQLAVKN